ncbi:hypothetical protein LTR37_009690 [Vermiconidia calcicola]|uniref:Uncharacterized protein n=1 Tax=Vermiconidia calcicola TaxID=1690605 RepID=A0ACC3N7J1_9PEZI|nr:hypothetical protein LTR37_009690 [Vermiconidia calcicola]
MSDRSRSASPAREGHQPRPKKQKPSGFKWKEKKPQAEEDAGAGSRDSGRLERGYRDRSPRRDSYRERERDRSPRRDRNGRGDDRYPRDRSPRSRNEGDNDRPGHAQDSRPFKPRRSEDNPNAPDQDNATAPPQSKPKKEKKSKPPPAPISNEPMIIVNINDRLGTKAAIPCLASDSVKAFKGIVAAHIGRQPHEIMLKRQGERPFKDQLTLEDYGVSSGVQLDLELDTGD